MDKINLLRFIIQAAPEETILDFSTYNEEWVVALLIDLNYQRTDRFFQIALTQSAKRRLIIRAADFLAWLEHMEIIAGRLLLFRAYDAFESCFPEPEFAAANPSLHIYIDLGLCEKPA